MDSGFTAQKLLERLSHQVAKHTGLLLVHADIHRLCEASTLTEFEMVCGERTWKVHQAVLAMHSKVMLKACTGEFNVRRQRFRLRSQLTTQQKAQERKLDLSAHGLAYIERLMSYI